MVSDDPLQGVRVSVITLTWNHLDYTKKAVESLIPILKENDEVIFVDNISTDGTKKYLKSVQLPCRKKVIILKEQKGIGAAYNIGFHEAKGDFIFIYDNDLEITSPDTIDRMIKIFKDTPKAGIVCPMCEMLVGIRNYKPPKHGLFNRIIDIPISWKKPYPMAPSAGFLIKKEIFEKIGYWDEQFDPYSIGDFDFARRVIEAGYYVLIDGFRYLKHGGSVSVQVHLAGDLLISNKYKYYKKWGVRLTHSLKRYERDGHV